MIGCLNTDVVTYFLFCPFVGTYHQSNTHQYYIVPNYEETYFLHQVLTPIYYFGLSRLSPIQIKLTKCQAQQLDVDEAIYAQIARESEADNKQQKRVRFELPDNQRQWPRVSFALTMRQKTADHDESTTRGRQSATNEQKQNKAAQATSYAVKKIISENGFSHNQFSNRSFPSNRSYLTAYQNKKGNKKVVFTGRLLGGVCTLYSIGESVQCTHSLLYVFDK